MPALAKRRIDLINLLLGRGANPNSQRNRENALHIAARSGCLDCVKALVEAGADVNAKTKDGKTPLHLAKFKGQREVADYLIADGVVLPMPAPISKKLAAADVEKGRASFSRLCACCHNAVPEEGAIRDRLCGTSSVATKHLWPRGVTPTPCWHGRLSGHTRT
ncbi:ankyrin repeat domain-containing protein [Mesorhizobium sp.]|uniref:ankyrin repeat domain-containing protein n=1 Tax=Mesorhizobium sp. TaxID=1871066 RepID=UPI00257D6D11|nr:ankyrin repeat domain-containing protein [Mesorhizobium sp.]